MQGGTNQEAGSIINGTLVTAGTAGLIATGSLLYTIKTQYDFSGKLRKINDKLTLLTENEKDMVANHVSIRKELYKLEDITKAINDIDKDMYNMRNDMEDLKYQMQELQQQRQQRPITQNRSIKPYVNSRTEELDSSEEEEEYVPIYNKRSAYGAVSKTAAIPTANKFHTKHRSPSASLTSSVSSIQGSNNPMGYKPRFFRKPRIESVDIPTYRIPRNTASKPESDSESEEENNEGEEYELEQGDVERYMT